MFTTQDIQLKGMIMIIVRSVFRNNTMEKGQMFEFMHNFRLTSFIDCVVQDNKGSFLEATPSNSGNGALEQMISFNNAQILRNTGRQHGLFHVLSNVYLEITNSNFIQNVGLGRGGIIYSELTNSFSSVVNSTFIKNSGYHGGIFYSETGGQIASINCLFDSNFAFEGGIGFLQNDGQMTMINNEYRFNLALRGSLFFVFNSNNDIMFQGGYIHENGFTYHPEINIHLIGQNKNLLQKLPFKQQLKIFNDVLSNNPDYLEFLYENEETIKTLLFRDQYTDNPQIQVIKARLIVGGDILILKQISLVKAQSVSFVSIANIVIYDVKNITGSLILVDQSIAQIEKMRVTFTQSTVPIFDIQSDSKLQINDILVQSHEGPILNLFNANATIINSKFQFIQFSKAAMSIFRVQNAILNISYSSISKINFDDQSGYEPLQTSIFKVRESELNILNLTAQEFNMILFQSVNSLISVDTSTFKSLSNNNSRGLVINAELSHVNITSSSFREIEGQEGSAIYSFNHFQQPNQYNIRIVDSVFSDIKSSIGGAVFMMNTNIIVRDSIYQRNSAGLSGSSLYLSCNKHRIHTCIFEMNNNTFQDNRAQNLGGAIYYDLIMPNGLLNNLYQNNTASYGKDYASYPNHLHLINNTEITTQKLVSGRNLNSSLQIGLFDQNDQLFTLDSQVDCLLTTDDIKISISGNTKVHANKGVCVFQDINIIGYPEYQSNIRVQTNGIVSDVDTSTISKIDIPITFRECIRGEVLQNRKCITCIKGTFSTDPSKTSCQSCPAKASCPGGSDIILRKGTWRKDQNSSKIYDCLNQKACLGGLNSSCSKEYTGIFCSKCKGKIGNKVYARSTGTSCSECSPIVVQLLLVGSVLLARGLYISYLLYNLLEKPNRNKPQTVLLRILTNYFQVISLVRGFNLEWPEVINVFLNLSVKVTDFQDSFFSFDCILLQLSDGKFSTYYLQVIIMGITPILMSIISVPIWFIIDIRKKLQQPENQLTSRDSNATMQGGTANRQNLEQGDHYQSEGVASVNKYGQYLSANVVSNRRVKRSLTNEQSGDNKSDMRRNKDNYKRRYSENKSTEKSNYQLQQLNSQNSLQNNQESAFSFKQKLMTTFFVIVMLWYPSIINYSFSLFTCVDYEDGHSYLIKDTSIRCWQGRDLFYQQTIGLTMIIAWGCIFPALIFWNIKNQKDRLNDPLNLKLYGIFYIGLSDKMYFWEILIMNVRKMILIIAATFLPTQRQGLKGYIGILGIFAQRQSSHYRKPFIDPHFNYIDDLASLSSILTIFGGIFFLSDGLGDRKSGIKIIESNQETFKVIIFIIVIGFNSYFLIKWILAFGLVQLRNHNKLFMKALLLVNYQLPKDIKDYETDLNHRLEKQQKDKLKREQQRNKEESQAFQLLPTPTKDLTLAPINQQNQAQTFPQAENRETQNVLQKAPSLLNISVEAPLSPIQPTVNENLKPLDSSLAHSERALLNEIDQCMNDEGAGLDEFRRQRVKYRNVDNLSFAEESNISHIQWQGSNNDSSHAFDKIKPIINMQHQQEQVTPVFKRQNVIREIDNSQWEVYNNRYK